MAHTPLKAAVGYHGAPGALSEGAAIELFSHHPKFANMKFETVPFLTYPELFEAAATGKVGFAILPIESSNAGTIQPVLDRLAVSDLHIIGEYKYSEPLCLLGLPGTKVDSVREISSHPDLLEQAREYIETTFDDRVTLRISGNSATCAQKLKESGLKESAVVSGTRAAQMYGLEILARDVAGKAVAPVTRYLMVSRTPVVPERHFEPKTSIAVTLRNSPGAFFKAMACFAMRDINITKIDTRPTKAADISFRPWEYTLYVDVDGSPATDPAVGRAVAQLEEIAVTVKVLGSYPRYQPPAHKPMGQFGEIGM